MKYFLFIIILAIGNMMAQTPREGTLATDLQIPIIMEGKRAGSMTLKAGTTVSIVQVLSDGVMISRGDLTPFKVGRESLIPGSIPAEASDARPVAVPAIAKATPAPSAIPAPESTATATTMPVATTTSEMSEKKGIGLNEKKRGFGTAQLEQLKVAWYYNWGPKKDLGTRVRFVPMIYSIRTLGASVSDDYILGYNEPDNEKQSNMSVKDALKGWPIIVSKAKYVGSPSMARNPLKSDWLHQFMNAKPKIDFLTVHWYKGVDPQHFIKDMEEIHGSYGMPLWVTEFAPQTAGESEREPGKYNQQQVNHFITETVRWMERTHWVQRYAWHDSVAGTSALFDRNGKLTATGKAYAEANLKKSQTDPPKDPP